MKRFLMLCLLHFHEWRVAVWSGLEADRRTQSGSFTILHAGYHLAHSMKHFHQQRMRVLDAQLYGDEFTRGWTEATLIAGRDIARERL